MHWRKYDQATGQFLGLYESIGYITVRGDYEEHFFDYGFCKEKSKLLYSYHKTIIPSSFSGTFFNRHKISYKSGSLPTDSSNIDFLLPSTTDQFKKINSHLGSLNLSPIDIAENSFDFQEGVSFDPSKLDVSYPEKTAITKAIVKTLKEITDLFNVKRIVKEKTEWRWKYRMDW